MIACRTQLAQRAGKTARAREILEPAGQALAGGRFGAARQAASGDVEQFGIPGASP